MYESQINTRADPGNAPTCTFAVTTVALFTYTLLPLIKKVTGKLSTVFACQRGLHSRVITHHSDLIVLTDVVSPECR